MPSNAELIRTARQKSNRQKQAANTALGTPPDFSVQRVHRAMKITDRIQSRACHWKARKRDAALGYIPIGKRSAEVGRFGCAARVGNIDQNHARATRESSSHRAATSS